MYKTHKYYVENATKEAEESFTKKKQAAFRRARY
jgi:hypothetical protein